VRGHDALAQGDGALARAGHASLDDQEVLVDLVVGEADRIGVCIGVVSVD
jgi:hypothetical protein